MAVRDVVQAAAGVGGAGEYIEDLFSTYLYTGTGATQTITNGIDLDGEGGLVWMKSRSLDGSNNSLVNTADGVNSGLVSNSASAATATDFSSFNANGFTLGSDVQGGYNNSGATFVSWTFRKAPKFCDVLTYTGTGLNTTIAHSLGAVPGMILVKKTSAGGVAWAVYHRSLANTEYLVLNTTAASATGATRWNNTTPTSSVFSLGTDASVNASGSTYVAYLFAHDAGGFGDDGEQNVISCGSYTGNGSTTGPVIDLGYEPQFLMFKRATGGTANWMMVDNMRGLNVTGRSELIPNLANAEYNNATSTIVEPTSTGFKLTANASQTNAASSDYIYIAIRRPMKTPESGTEVFSTNTATYSANQVVTTGFPVDMLMMKGRTITFGNLVYDRLRGLASTNTSPYDAQLLTSDTSAESSGDYTNTANNTGYQISPGFSGFSSVNWNFRRAPGFMDVVCFTGTGVAHTEAHNLGVVPELMIVKTRSNAVGWAVSVGAVGYTNGSRLELTDPFYSEPNRITGTPTTTTFPVGTDAYVNVSARTYVAYLFASLPGVSKVSSYTGTGADLNVDCGFSAGARFILIKRTDSTGDWYVWDSARGIVAGNDPYLLLNSTAAEVTNTDYIDPLSSGFTVTSSAPAALNASGGTYIFLAIA
jgi:hypothetical protein